MLKKTSIVALNRSFVHNPDGVWMDEYLNYTRASRTGVATYLASNLAYALTSKGKPYKRVRTLREAVNQLRVHELSH